MRDATSQPVVFDRDRMVLTIGDRSISVPDPSGGNEAVLRAYLTLVSEVRGVTIGSPVEIRHDDVVALAEMLDLEDADLERHLVELLCLSPAGAAEVHGRIRRHRALTAAATLAFGGLALLGATNISSPDPSPPAPVRTAAHATVASAPAPEPSTTTTEAPAPVASAAPVAAATPDSVIPPPDDPDGVEIGDALVIERGQQPDDPDVQIGDSVTHER